MVWIHAESYKGLGIHKFVHRARLKKLVNILKELNLAKEGTWADFGCSDGFIFSYLREELGIFNHWKLYGFDFFNDLLEEARNRNLSNSIFIKFDLNKIDESYQSLFDIVTSFETIEHVGNYKNAFENIYLSCKPNGFILLSVPNEIGFPGIIKFIGRKLLRKNPYKSFFKNSTELKYLITLFNGRDIEVFRGQEATGWDQHLGFNYKNFEKYIFDEYIKKKKCNFIKKVTSFFRFNILYILKKIE